MPRNATGALAAPVLAAGLCGAQPATAQTSDLYLTDYDTSMTWVVRGGQIVRQFSRSAVSGQDTGCTVGTTLRCVGTFVGDTGREYALTGTPLAASYPNADWDSLYDGASDGTRNWSIAHNDSGSGYALAWDPADDTLWVPGAFSTAGSLFQYSKTGTLLQTVTIAGLGNVVGAEFGSGALAEAVIPTLEGSALAGFTLLMAFAGAYAARRALQA